MWVTPKQYPSATMKPSCPTETCKTPSQNYDQYMYTITPIQMKIQMKDIKKSHLHNTVKDSKRTALSHNANYITLNIILPAKFNFVINCNIKSLSFISIPSVHNVLHCKLLISILFSFMLLHYLYTHYNNTNH